MNKKDHSEVSAVKKFIAKDVQRDEHGFWAHPDLPLTESNEEFKGWLAQNNLECVAVDMEFDCDPNSEAYREYFENDAEPSCLKWEATPPVGEGWFVMCYGENEDGACCWWVREKQETKGLTMGVVFSEAQLSEIIFNLGIDLRAFFSANKEIAFREFYSNELMFTVDGELYGYHLVTCDWYFYDGTKRSQNLTTEKLLDHFNGVRRY